MSSIHFGSASAEPLSTGGSESPPRASWTPSDSVHSGSASAEPSSTSAHERLTVAEVKSGDAEPVTNCAAADRDGWLTFDAYVAWVAALSGVTTTALSTAPAETERTLEDHRSTVVVPARRRMWRKVWPMRSAPVPAMTRRHRLSASVIRRVLAKTG